ncbi:MAG TPA: alpha/beta hydrolase, partial [Myxococcaceae bacterium]
MGRELGRIIRSASTAADDRQEGTWVLVDAGRSRLLCSSCFSLGKPAPRRRKPPEAKFSTGRHVANVGGISFTYYVAGTGPLLVVQAPGWGIGSEYLRNGLVPLEKDFTLLFYDTRGSGDSSRPRDEGAMSTSDMVNDLEALRAFWELKVLTLLGHSHGGAIALGYAIRHPSRVKKLLVVDSNIQGYDDDALIEQEIEKRRGDKRFASAIEQLESKTRATNDIEFKAVIGREAPIYFHDPERYLPRLQETAPGLPSLWVRRANSAADAKSS